MNELSFGTLIAVFEEIFGRGVFWVMVAAAALVTLGYLYVLIRDRSVSWKKFLLAQLSMPIGAVAAVWFVLAMTDSRLSDIGGPVDVIVYPGCGHAFLNDTREEAYRPDEAKDAWDGMLRFLRSYLG